MVESPPLLKNEGMPEMLWIALTKMRGAASVSLSGIMGILHVLSWTYLVQVKLMFST